MATIAIAAPEPFLKRVWAKFTAFAEVADMDSTSYLDLRVQRLERQLAELERTMPYRQHTGGEV